jgi:ABC-2 type transport system permease protein
MSRSGAIIVTDLRNDLRSRALVIVLLGIVALCVVAAGVIAGRFIIAPAVDAGRSADTLGYDLGLVAYVTAFVLTGVTYCVLFSVPLAREKARGAIESLLATPAGVRQVWLAKSAALFLPGVVLGTLLPLCLTLFISYAYLRPRYGFVLNLWLALCTYIAVPLVYFALSLLIHVVGLRGRTVDANVIAIIFVSGATALMSNLATRQTLDATSWPFLAANLGLAAALAAAALLLLPSLSKERIVASCHR